ncbi:cytochrome c oxidase subunit 4 isoform 1, mitochondrial-like [Cimex lectularius]|uniref:Cytochrome c oxidase subunit 4 n=1 Tax=Cimex lectularius TaxID=79782 RepID=A0A8I6S1Q2_CIMLE|nr:cytochrome c oxidase subunit 4 isoform 1, mitochondrial-like [Cimex lectularius]XP_014254212.1 cytochrome c oxidase subunit 4 isoform 1, mitochondrial-like [Cimex lectularius]XP_014254213.1 cytochrome c oxidase subunit 4 isoform 1, mitochondrial-like [Cimex lectularius]
MLSRMFISQVRQFSQRRLLCTEASLTKSVIGTREVVGYGINGTPSYWDLEMFPYPAVRFREITPNIKALKEKEKGNWKSLTIDEKKCLYRVSFCQTFAEIGAPSGEWKYITGSVLLVLSAAISLYTTIYVLTRGEPPNSFKLESQQAQLKRIIQLRMDPIDGISSKWDYEKNKWK